MMELLKDKAGTVAPPHRGSSWKTKFSMMMEDQALRGRRLGGTGQAPLPENHLALETFK